MKIGPVKEPLKVAGQALRHIARPIGERRVDDVISIISKQRRAVQTEVGKLINRNQMLRDMGTSIQLAMTPINALVAHILVGVSKLCCIREGRMAKNALENLSSAVQSRDPDALHQAVVQGQAITYNNLVETLPYVADCLQRPLTPFDSAAVLAERQRIVRLGYDLTQAGVGDTSAIRTPERQLLRQEIIDQLYGQGAPRKDRQAYIVTGLPGAGKSSTAQQIIARSGVLNIEGDDIRAALPEFQQNRNQYQVNAEKALIRGALKERAFKAGDNILLDYVPGKVGPDGQGVSGSNGTLRANLEQLKAHGYTVHLIHIDTTVETAAAHMMGRFEKTGRLSDPLADTMLINIPRQDVEALRHDATVVDTFTRIDNNGRSPRVVEADAHDHGREIHRPLELP